MKRTVLLTLAALLLVPLALLRAADVPKPTHPSIHAVRGLSRALGRLEFAS